MKTYQISIGAYICALSAMPTAIVR